MGSHARTPLSLTRKARRLSHYAHSPDTHIHMHPHAHTRPHTHTHMQDGSCPCWSGGDEQWASARALHCNRHDRDGDSRPCTDGRLKFALHAYSQSRGTVLTRNTRPNTFMQVGSCPCRSGGDGQWAPARALHCDRHDRNSHPRPCTCGRVFAFACQGGRPSPGQCGQTRGVRGEGRDSDRACEECGKPKRPLREAACHQLLMIANVRATRAHAKVNICVYFVLFADP